MKKKKNYAGRKLILTSLLASFALITGCSAREGALTRQGMEAVASLDYNGALDLFAQAREAGEPLQLLSRGEGIAYMGLARYDDAVEAFTESLHSSDWRITSLEGDTNYYLAAAFEKKEDHQSAIEVYDSILGMWPKEKTALYLRGVVKLRSGDFDSANRDFLTALDLDPQDYGLVMNIFDTLKEAGYISAGQEYLTSTLDRYEASMTDYERGRIYFALENYEEAKKSLEQARDTGPDAVMYLGMSYEALGDFNYATSVYQGYLNSHPGDPAILNRLGMCRMGMGDYEGALLSFSQGLENEDSSQRQSLLFNQIAATEYTGDFNSAKSLMTQYLALYPDDPAAIRESQFLSTR